jgi:hypothetical protein
VVEFAGLLEFAEPMQVEGEVVGGVEGVGVVVAVGAVAPVEGVLVEFAGPLELPRARSLAAR